MAMDNFLQVQQMIANMDEDQMVARLMETNPNIDPTAIIKTSVGKQGPVPGSQIVPGDANQPGQEINAGIAAGLPFAAGGAGGGSPAIPAMLQALSGVQSGQQTAQQLPAPHLFGFGSEQPRKNFIDLPDAPGRFGNLMFGGKK